MQKYRRLFIALAVLMSGVALTPYLSLSAERFGWERYANAYEFRDVDIVDFAFVPQVLIVPVGTTVRWTNVGAVNHTVTSDTLVFDSGVLAPGDFYDYAFTAVGSYGYVCSIHPTMTGTVVVVEQVFRSYLPIILRQG